MPIHGNPDDLRSVGPEARAHIDEALAAGRETAAASDAAVPVPLAGPTSATPSTVAEGTSARTVLLVLLGAGGAIALLIAGMLLGGVLRPTGTVPGPIVGLPTAGAAPAGGAGLTPSAGGAGSEQGSARAAAATAQAVADAATAQTQAGQATSASNQAQTLLQSAQTAAAQVASLSAATLARNPSATDPGTTLQPLQQGDTELLALVAQVQQASAAAGTAAQDAGHIAQTDAGAADAASRAEAAQSEAQAAFGETQAAGGQVGHLLTQAESEAQAWEAVHSAPAGYFGAQVEDPPASFSVQGCEVDVAAPGSPASDAGLVGRTQRTDPVGDVISSITDATDAGAVWPVPDCAAFNTALQQTRAGDQVAVAYYHRQVVWYELSGRWLLESGTATVTAAPGTNCPAALTGTISPALAGSRINLTITLSGPAGTRPGMGVILDTGGVETIFPNALLQALGYRPFLPLLTGGVVPGAVATANLYRVPASALTVDDGGASVPLATGTLTVMGINNGTDYGLGPDILKQGAKLSTAGDHWTLTPPCT